MIFKASFSCSCCHEHVNERTLWEVQTEMSLRAVGRVSGVCLQPAFLRTEPASPFQSPELELVSDVQEIPKVIGVRLESLSQGHVGHQQCLWFGDP